MWLVYTSSPNLKENSTNQVLAMLMDFCHARLLTLITYYVTVPDRNQILCNNREDAFKVWCNFTVWCNFGVILVKPS